MIQREVVKGNFYDESDVLMVIAPLDHLWVLANVYEVDQAKVALGQKMEIQFPFLQQTTHGDRRVRLQRGLPGNTCRPDPGLDPQPGRQAEVRHARQGRSSRSRR